MCTSWITVILIKFTNFQGYKWIITLTCIHKYTTTWVYSPLPCREPWVKCSEREPLSWCSHPRSRCRSPRGLSSPVCHSVSRAPPGPRHPRHQSDCQQDQDLQALHVVKDMTRKFVYECPITLLRVAKSGTIWRRKDKIQSLVCNYVTLLCFASEVKFTRLTHLCLIWVHQRELLPPH